MAKATDEKIIAALLANGTIKATASAVGISERTLYDRMNNGEFIAKYNSAKADLIRQAVININNYLQAAIDTTADIMQDKSNNAAVRLQAAQTILNNAGKYTQRLQDAEAAVKRQIESNNFDLETFFLNR